MVGVTEESAPSVMDSQTNSVETSFKMDAIHNSESGLEKSELVNTTLLGKVTTINSTSDHDSPENTNNKDNNDTELLLQSLDRKGNRSIDYSNGIDVEGVFSMPGSPSSTRRSSPTSEKSIHLHLSPTGNSSDENLSDIDEGGLDNLSLAIEAHPTETSGKEGVVKELEENVTEKDSIKTLAVSDKESDTEQLQDENDEIEDSSDKEIEETGSDKAKSEQTDTTENLSACSDDADISAQTCNSTESLEVEKCKQEDELEENPKPEIEQKEKSDVAEQQKVKPEEMLEEKPKLEEHGDIIAQVLKVLTEDSDETLDDDTALDSYEKDFRDDEDTKKKDKNLEKDKSEDEDDKSLSHGMDIDEDNSEDVDDDLALRISPTPSEDEMELAENTELPEDDIEASNDADDKLQSNCIDIAEEDEITIDENTNLTGVSNISITSVGTILVPKGVKRVTVFDGSLPEVKKVKISPALLSGSILKEELSKKLPQFDAPQEKNKLSEMTREDLEELIKAKVCEVLMCRSQLSTLLEHCSKFDESNDRARKKLSLLEKQLVECRSIMQKLANDLKLKHPSTVMPVKITRSVGLQVHVQSNLLPVIQRKQNVKAFGQSPIKANGIGVATANTLKSSLLNNAINRANIQNKKANNSSLTLLPTGQTPTTPTKPIGIVSPPKINNGPILSSTATVSKVTIPNQIFQTKITANPQPTPGPGVIDLTDDDEAANKSKLQPPINAVLPTLLASPAVSQAGMTIQQLPTGSIRFVSQQQLRQPGTLISPVVQGAGPRLTYLLSTVPPGTGTTNPQVIFTTATPGQPQTIGRPMTQIPTQTLAALAGSKPGSQIFLKSSTGSPTIYRPVQATQIRPILGLPGTRLQAPTAVVPSNNRPIQNAMIYNTPPPRVNIQPTSVNKANGSTTVINRGAPIVKHPAPLPEIIESALSTLPTRPDLKIDRTVNGIVLSWNMNLEACPKEVASYQLYAYQEGASPPKSTLWKKVGEIKALPLPMACTLTQFMEGHTYHFSVRAIDVRSRLGPFSRPQTVALIRKTTGS